jgi:hypothetical protein
VTYSAPFTISGWNDAECQISLRLGLYTRLCEVFFYLILVRGFLEQLKMQKGNSRLVFVVESCL